MGTETMVQTLSLGIVKAIERIAELEAQVEQLTDERDKYWRNLTLCLIELHERAEAHEVADTEGEVRRLALLRAIAERDAALAEVEGLRTERAALQARTCPPWLVELAERLRTQDNACTANPVFTVQQRKRITGLDTMWTDDTTWIEEGDECGSERAAELEAEWKRTGSEPDECTRTGYADVWEHVMSFFTNAAALDYIERNRHRMTDPRIWVDSAYRNSEWQQVVKFLLECGSVSDGGAG